MESSSFPTSFPHHLFHSVGSGRRVMWFRLALVDKKHFYVIARTPLMLPRLDGDSVPIYATKAFSYRRVIT